MLYTVILKFCLHPTIPESYLLLKRYVESGDLNSCFIQLS